MDRLEKSLFYTSDLPPEQRFSAWRDSISVIFDVSRADTVNPDDFDASLCSYLFNGQCMIARCDTTSQRFERSEMHMARDGLDHYLIQAMVSGSQRILQGSREHHFRPGNLLVIDLAAGHTAHTSSFSHVSLVLPRPLLAPLLKNPDIHVSRVLTQDDPLVKLAHNHLITMFDIAEDLSPGQAANLLLPTVSLIAAALNGSTESVEYGSSSVARSLLMRAKAEIERNLHNDVPVEHYCARLGISKSTLYRLFESCGGVRAYIQERRLQRSAQMLASPHHGHLHIYEVAFSLGFKSEAHFSRAFRQRFSRSPTEVRDFGLVPASAESPLAPDWVGSKVGDRHYEQWLASTLKA